MSKILFEQTREKFQLASYCSWSMRSRLCASGSIDARLVAARKLNKGQQCSTKASKRKESGGPFETGLLSRKSCWLGRKSVRKSVASGSETEPDVGPSSRSSN